MTSRELRALVGEKDSDFVGEVVNRSLVNGRVVAMQVRSSDGETRSLSPTECREPTKAERATRERNTPTPVDRTTTEERTTLCRCGEQIQQSRQGTRSGGFRAWLPAACMACLKGASVRPSVAKIRTNLRTR